MKQVQVQVFIAIIGQDLALQDSVLGGWHWHLTVGVSGSEITSPPLFFQPHHRYQVQVQKFKISSNFLIFFFYTPSSHKALR